MSVNVRLTETVNLTNLSVRGKGGSATKEETLRYINSKLNADGNLYTPIDEKEWKYKSIHEITMIRVFKVVSTVICIHEILTITADVYTYMVLRDMFKFFTNTRSLHVVDVDIANVHIPSFPLLINSSIQGRGVESITFGYNETLQFIHIMNTRITKLSETLRNVPSLEHISVADSVALDDVRVLQNRNDFPYLKEIMLYHNGPNVLMDQIKDIHGARVFFYPS